MSPWFTDPSTHFTLVREEQPVGDGGLTAVRPTGEVRCDECGAVAENIDEIPHDASCSQRWAKSRWYAEQFPEC
jgi:hypothetical protein